MTARFIEPVPFGARRFIRVSVPTVAVAHFAARWPCFGRIGPLWFEFDPDGDLVDMGGDRGMDPAGVAALADDARDGRIPGARARATGWVAAGPGPDPSGTRPR